MLIKVYAMQNNKTNDFKMPMYFKTHKEAIENIANWVNSEEFPEIDPIEYELFELGQFDTQTGKHELLEKPQHHCNIRKFAKTAVEQMQQKILKHKKEITKLISSIEKEKETV